MRKAPKKAEFFILPDGTIRFIYDDALKPVLELGECHVSRASHVDPILEDGKINWYADMTPCGHLERLGPFNTRDEAIKAEIAFLTEKVLPLPMISVEEDSAIKSYQETKEANRKHFL